MEKYTGKVEAISVKKMDKPDKFENTHRASIKMDDGNWYSLGSMKSDTLTVEDDDGKWRSLGTGSQILIKYEMNGEYRNSKRSQITVIDLVDGGGSSRPAAKQEAQKPGGSAPTMTSNLAGIEAGHAINNAIAWITSKNHHRASTDLSVNEDELVTVATQIHAATRRVQAAILNPREVKPPTLPGAPSDPKPTPKAKAPKKPAVEETWEDEEGDDIPF